MHPLYTNLQVNTLPIHFLCRKKIFNLYNNIITLDLHLGITDKIERINLLSKERMQEVNHE